MDIKKMLSNNVAIGKEEFASLEERTKDVLGAMCDVALLKERALNLKKGGTDAVAIKKQIFDITKNASVIGKCVAGAEKLVDPYIAKLASAPNLISKRVNTVLDLIIDEPSLFTKLSDEDDVTTAFSEVHAAQVALKDKEEQLRTVIGNMVEYAISEKDKFINIK